ncbi:MAG: hypothetical protein R2747_22580 [Pyrinomonadaceae bacterium]
MGFVFFIALLVGLIFINVCSLMCSVQFVTGEMLPFSKAIKAVLGLNVVAFGVVLALGFVREQTSGLILGGRGSFQLVTRMSDPSDFLFTVIQFSLIFLVWWIGNTFLLADRDGEKNFYQGLGVTFAYFALNFLALVLVGLIYGIRLI